MDDIISFSFLRLEGILDDPRVNAINQKQHLSFRNEIDFEIEFKVINILFVKLSVHLNQIIFSFSA